MYKGIYGIDNINKSLQDIFNPKDKDKKDTKVEDGKQPITNPNPTLKPGMKPPIPTPSPIPTVIPTRDKNKLKEQAYIEPSPVPKTKEEKLFEQYEDLYKKGLISKEDLELKREELLKK